MSYISGAHNSKNKCCYNAKPSAYYFHMKTRIYIYKIYIFYQRFLSQTLTFHRAAGETHLRILRHLFVTLHVRWLSRIFNCNACGYQTATRLYLPPYRITIWLIDWWCNVCLITWRIDSRLFVTAIWQEKKIKISADFQISISITLIWMFWEIDL